MDTKEMLTEFRDQYFLIDSMIASLEKRKLHLKMIIEKLEKDKDDVFLQASEIVVKDMKTHVSRVDEYNAAQDAPGFFDTKPEVRPPQQQQQQAYHQHITPPPVQTPKSYSSPKPVRKPQSPDVDTMIDDFCQRRES